MNVAVCVKQIPDPSVRSSLDTNKNLDRSGKLLLDEADTYGVEIALRLVEQAGEGDVTLVSMGPTEDLSGLRTALAMGATRAVVASDDALRGTDALGTAKVLAALIRPISPDLIVCAVESSDGYTGTTPVQLAELLDLPSITFAKSVRVEGATLKVNRQTESGFDEVSSPLPCLVTVTGGVVEPRYASFKGIMAAKSKPIDVFNVAELGLSGQVGTVGARQEIIDVVVAPTRQAGDKYVDEGDGAQRIVEFLESLKVI